MTAVRFWIIIFQSPRDRRQLLLRLVCGDARFQKHEALERARVAIFQLVSRRVKDLLHRYRDPELERDSDEGTVKIFRRNADDRVLNAIQILRFPDNLWVTLITVLPHLVADDCDWMRIAPDAFVRREAAAQNRTHAERIKIVRSNETADRALGPVADAQRCSD